MREAEVEDHVVLGRSLRDNWTMREIAAGRGGMEVHRVQGSYCGYYWLISSSILAQYFSPLVLSSITYIQ